MVNVGKPPPKVKSEISATIKNSLLKNGFNIIKLDLLLGFARVNLPWNDTSILWKITLDGGVGWGDLQIHRLHKVWHQ